MDLIGLRVRHKSHGDGTIVKMENHYITVEFSSEQIQFTFPDAFEKHLKALDDKRQVEILVCLEEKKDAIEQERLAKEAALLEEEKRRIEEQIKKTRKKKRKTTPKTIDEMFLPDYHVEKLKRQPILTYQQVEEQFGIRIQGFGKGINPTESTVVLISSINKADGKFVYHDHWTLDGDYLYSGEGKNGNQVMNKGNLAIRDAARNGKTIHLFVKFSPKEYYYQGIFELKDYTYEDEEDEEGYIRKEYKFLLKKSE